MTHTLYVIKGHLTRWLHLPLAFGDHSHVDDHVIFYGALGRRQTEEGDESLSRGSLWLSMLQGSQPPPHPLTDIIQVGLSDKCTAWD